jgi:glycosyltransferase involved in cell wall biosynthesis
MPRLSVVMGVHNGLPWITAAIDSILGQSFEDFELVVVDDGSTDATPEMLQSLRDPRLRLDWQRRAGLTVALLRGLALSESPLVARMDADDVARPERLAAQVAFLDAHPEVGLLGTGGHEIGQSGDVLGTLHPPARDQMIRRALIRYNPFIHSSVVFRRAAYEAAGGYDPRLPVAQDYDLWMRMSRVTRMANLPEPLVFRRLTRNRVSSAREEARLRAEVRIRLRALRRRDYPAWCAVFLVKPFVALALPPGLRRRVRRAFRGDGRSGVGLGGG